MHLLTTAERLRIEIYDRAFRRWSAPDHLARSYDPGSKTRPWPEGFVGNCTFSDPVTTELNERYRHCLTDLARKLSRYRWRTMIWDMDYLWLNKMTVWDDSSTDTLWESRAIHWLLGRLQEHAFFPGDPCDINLIRRCANCGRWFVALTNHQRFCNQLCRKHNASQSPEFKQKRRSYMRERYRPMQKELERKALEQAKRNRHKSKGAK